MRICTLTLATKICCLLLYLSFNSLEAQVGVNTTSPNPAAALEISSTNKGIIIPKVTLTSTADNTTIILPALVTVPATGLLVYNTTQNGSGSTQVNPGYYYWGGNSWRRMFNEGYQIEYRQTAEVIPPVLSNYYILTGLDTGSGFTVPFTGTYQIILNAYYAAGPINNTATDGAVQGATGVWMTTGGGAFQSLKETYVTSSSKRFSGTNYNGLGQNVTTILNVELDSSESYRIIGVCSAWLSNNTTNNGYFGRDTSSYTNAGGVNDAMRGTMSIKLIKQH